MHPAESLAVALALADIADDITMERFRAVDLIVETKPDLTPVSEADQAVERAIREHLAIHARDHSVLGEEYGDDGDDAEWRWVIDPIDGTKNYVRGVPVWATLIGLERGGEVVTGVVSAPALGSRWWAGTGLGAYRDGHRIHVSGVHELADAQLSFAMEYNDDGTPGTSSARMLRLSQSCWRTRGFGDFWQHVLVADGSFDISIDPIVARWDIAALFPIIEEAGGRWSDLGGGRDASGVSGLVCTNGALHDAAIEVLGLDIT